MAEEIIGYDLDGYEAVTNALRMLVNEYPALEDGEKIAFGVLGEDEGLAMFPSSSAVIQSERVDITDHVTQTCMYPFYIYYRAGSLTENRKANVKEWLDDLGRWLERQPIELDGSTVQLAGYPPLTKNRKFTDIKRQTQAYQAVVNGNQTEDWVLYLNARYRNEYDK